MKKNIPKLLWQPSISFAEQSNLQKYMDWLEKKGNLKFSKYSDLWQWSVDNIEDFWESIWQYFEIQSYLPYTSVLSSHKMPGAKWFEGSTLNYAEHIFKQENDKNPALLFQSERHNLTEMSWAELRGRVASLRHWLQQQGLKKGDTVVAYLPNIPEATIAFLATCSLGAIWSSCSPDFGVQSVVDRFLQIKPKVLITVDGYQYGGKRYDRMEEVSALIEALPTLEKVVLIPYLNADSSFKNTKKETQWEATQVFQEEKLTFEALPFAHPIWVLYSSGTTGIPKAITHSQGGALLEHLKYLVLQNDVKPGERFYWFATTGWMMWNFVQASLLAGATAVLYDGSPGFPDMNMQWKLAEEAKINHFGTSAPFLVACMNREVKPAKENNLSALRSIGSTGSPLPPEAFDYVYREIKNDLWLCSMSGGTDVCTAFVGSNPLDFVYLGEIQCRALGCAMYAWDENGNEIIDEVGEMVITKPMPSMPIYFWNDEGNKRYLSSYFEMYPNIWRHGDWIQLTKRGSLTIHGRSDATLNRQGVRIGTSEIYNAVDKIKEVADSIIVNLELSGGRHYMPLFVVLEEGAALTEALIKKIKNQLRSEYSPRHVPDEIILVPEIPYTISGKKLEAPIKKILLGMPLKKAANKDVMRNPSALDFFINMEKKNG